MNAQTDYSGYKECGHPEYRKTADGPQPNDCGCDGDNYAEASAAHAAINTTDLADPFAGMPNADDSENGEFSPVKTIRPVRAFEITDRAGQALMILIEAHDAGLPMPGHISAGAHDHGEFRSSSIRFQLADDDEVGAWARHFGRPFVSEKHGSSVTLMTTGQHDVQAYYYEMPAEKPVPPQPPMTDTMSGSYVPGLAEHTAAAQEKIIEASR